MTLCIQIIVIAAITAQAFTRRLTIDEQIQDAMDQAANSSTHGLMHSQGGQERTDMDIILTEDQIDSMNSNSRRKRNAIKNSIYRWSSSTLVYSIVPGDFSAAETNTIFSAMADWEQHTCLQFRTKTSSDTYYIEISQGDGGCYSHLGYVRLSPQLIGLGTGCVNDKDIPVHELGHSIGLHHEHKRPDRDTYVEILTENIVSGRESQFTISSTSSVSDFGTAYDYRSVMHYGRRFFSKDRFNLDTIRTKDAFYQDIIGTAPTLSYSDAEIVNIMYDCAAAAGCPSITCSGYQGKDCKCYCPDNDGINIIECSDSGDGTTTTAAATTIAAATTAAPKTATATTTAATTTAAATTTTAATTTAVTTTAAATTTPAATTPAATTTAAPGTCQDKWPRARCSRRTRWWLRACTRIQVVRENCALTCQTCGTAIGDESCQDLWSRRICSRRRYWCTRSQRVRNNCPQTCGTCSAGTDSCTDIWNPRRCSTLASRGQCRRSRLVRQKCMRSCRRCTEATGNNSSTQG